MGRWDAFWKAVEDDRPTLVPGWGLSAAERSTKVYVQGERTSWKEDTTDWSFWKLARTAGDARSTYSTEKIVDDDLYRANLRLDREMEADAFHEHALETAAFDEAFEGFRNASAHDFDWRADFGRRQFWDDAAFRQSSEFKHGLPPQFSHLTLTPREDRTGVNDELHLPLSSFATQTLYPLQVLRQSPNREFVSLREAFAFTIWHRSHLGPKDPETVNIVIDPGQSIEQVFNAFPVTSGSERFEVHATFQAEDETGERSESPQAIVKRHVGNTPITPFWDHAYWEISVGPHAKPVRLDIITKEAVLGFAIQYRKLVGAPARANPSEQFRQWLQALMTAAEARAMQVGWNSLAHSVVPLEFDTRHFRFLKQGPVRPLTQAEEEYKRSMDTAGGRLLRTLDARDPERIRRRDEERARDLARRVARDGVFWWRKVDGKREVWAGETDVWKAPRESIRLQEPHLPGFTQPQPQPQPPPALSAPASSPAPLPDAPKAANGPVTTKRILIVMFLLLVLFKFKLALVLAVPIGLVWMIVFFGKQAIAERRRDHK